MIRFSEVLGHERTLEILRRALASGRVHHAYLFHGSPGVGKGGVAEAFAAALLCESAEEPEACGRCASCVRVKSHTHPDLHRLEVPEGKSRIAIEQFHALEAALQLVAYSRRRRVAIVDPADLLSREAQHAFLKTLEEPRPDTVLVLVSALPSALLTTIRSRCQPVAFGPIPADRLARALTERWGVPRERAGLLAGLSRGSVGRAIALEKEEALAQRDMLLDVAAQASRGVVGPGLVWAERFRGLPDDRDRALGLLDLAALYARDVLVIASGGREADLAHRDRADRIARDAAVPGAPAQAARAIERIERTRRDIQHNVNPSLALQVLLTDLAARPGAPP
jgi:DNA polymerase-3 subunit delta'